MDRESVDWQGYIPAITTPFDEEQRLDLKMLVALLEWLAEEGMHGIVLAGTTGEWFSMTAAEKAALFTTAGEVLKGRMTLIGGCNAFTAREVIARATDATRSGLDGILLSPPPYVRPTECEIFAFYEEVNDAVSLPICVYNWPPGTNVDMSLALLERLATLDKVVAIKNSTGNPDHFLAVFRALKHRVRIFGVPMTEQGADLVKEGASGVMGAGAVLGRDQPGFFNALWAGDTKRALALGARDQRIMQDWFHPDYTARFGSAQAVFKTALNLQGLPGGFPRRPILPLQPEQVAIIKTTLGSLGRLPYDNE